MFIKPTFLYQETLFVPPTSCPYGLDFGSLILDLRCAVLSSDFKWRTSFFSPNNPKSYTIYGLPTSIATCISRPMHPHLWQKLYINLIPNLNKSYFFVLKEWMEALD